MWYPGVDGLDRRVEMDVLGGRDQHHVGFDAIGEEVVVMRIAPAGRQSEIPREGMAAQVVYIDDGDGCSRSGYRRAYSRYLLARFPAPITTIRTGRGNGRFVFHRNPPKGYIGRIRCGAARRQVTSFGIGCGAFRAVPRGSPSGKRSGREAAPAVVICGPRPDPAHAGCGTGCRHHGPAGRYGPTY